MVQWHLTAKGQWLSVTTQLKDNTWFSVIIKQPKDKTWFSSSAQNETVIPWLKAETMAASLEMNCVDVSTQPKGQCLYCCQQSIKEPQDIACISVLNKGTGVIT